MTPVKGLSTLSILVAPCLPTVAGDWYLVANVGEATCQARCPRSCAKRQDFSGRQETTDQRAGESIQPTAYFFFAPAALASLTSSFCSALLFA
jgi:hypothetical protein